MSSSLRRAQAAYDARAEPCETDAEFARQRWLEKEIKDILDCPYTFATASLQHGEIEDIETIGAAILALNIISTDLGNAVERVALAHAEATLELLNEETS